MGRSFSAAISGSLGQVVGASTVAAVALPGAGPPAAIPPSGAYRYEQPYLFQSARAASEPNHLGPEYVNATPLLLGREGPTNLYVDRACGWTWDRNGGDFISNNPPTYTRNAASPTPWGSVLMTTLTGTPTITITSALQYIQSNSRWNAYLLSITGGTRKIASKFHATAAPPTITGTYTDASPFTLACRIVAYNQVGMLNDIVPQTTNAETSFPVFVEFDLPTKAVQSASLNFSVTSGTGGNATIGVYICDPPVNQEPQVLGIAQNYPDDVGIGAHASVIGHMLTPDGCTIDQFVTPTVSQEGEIGFDPYIWNPAASHDFTKLPHSAISAPTSILKGGKWVGGVSTTGVNSYSQVSFVDSNYTDEGFVPLAPGVGAMRFFMEAAPVDWNGLPYGDGSVCGGSPGHATTHKRIYFPEPIFGLVDDIFVRYYARIGTPDGSPYRMPMNKIYQVSNKTSGPLLTTDSIGWTDCGGKWGIVADQDTTYGYNSQTSGGNKGYQNRLSWGDCYADDVGPDLGGIRIGFHTYDDSVNQPAAYRYIGDDPRENQFGNRGGLGAILYADNWYCIEHQFKNNTVFPATSFRNAPWSRSGSTITVTRNNHGLVRPTLMVLESSDHAAVPVLGADSAITVLNVNQFSFTGVDAGATSGTVTLSDYLPDGIYRVWIDGRLAYERLNVAKRFLPVYDPGYVPAERRPCRELGHSQILFNWFHGGAFLNSVDRVTFLTNLVYGTSYIGPIVPSEPAWLAAQPSMTWIPVNDTGTAGDSNGTRIGTMTDMAYLQDPAVTGIPESAGLFGPAPNYSPLPAYNGVASGRVRGGIMEYSGGCLRENGSYLLCWGGGGAGSYPGNELVGLKLEDDVPTWHPYSRATHLNKIPPKGYFDPLLLTDQWPSEHVSYNFDGTPMARHSYFGPQFINGLDRFFQFGSGPCWVSDSTSEIAVVDSLDWTGDWRTTQWSPGCAYPCADGQAYTYTVPPYNPGPFTNPYTVAAPYHPHVPPNLSAAIIGRCFHKHPVTEKVYAGTGTGMNCFDPFANGGRGTWTREGPVSWSMGGRDIAQSLYCIDPTRNKMLIIPMSGSSQNRATPPYFHPWTYTLAGTAGVSPTSAVFTGTYGGDGTTNPGIFAQRTDCCGIVWCPDLDCFVFCMNDNWVGGGQSFEGGTSSDPTGFYTIRYVNDGEWEVERLAIAGNGPRFRPSPGGGLRWSVMIGGRMQYVPALRGIAIVPDQFQPLYFVRTF